MLLASLDILISSQTVLSHQDSVSQKSCHQNRCWRSPLTFSTASVKHFQELRKLSGFLIQFLVQGNTFPSGCFYCVLLSPCDVHLLPDKRSILGKNCWLLQYFCQFIEALNVVLHEPDVVRFVMPYRVTLCLLYQPFLPSKNWGTFFLFCIFPDKSLLGIYSLFLPTYIRVFFLTDVWAGGNKLLDAISKLLYRFLVFLLWRCMYVILNVWSYSAVYLVMSKSQHFAAVQQ